MSRFIGRGVVRSALVSAGVLLCVASALPVAAQQPPTTIAITSAPVTLYRGCDTFVVRAPVGTPWSAILARVADPTAVVGIWRYDNLLQRYLSAYFQNSGAPVDLPQGTGAPIFALWACVSADTSIS